MTKAVHRFLEGAAKAGIEDSRRKSIREIKANVAVSLTLLFFYFAKQTGPGALIGR